VSVRHGGNVYRIARALCRRVENLIDFSANINPLGFPEAVMAIFQNPHTYLLNYPDPDATECTAALIHYHRIPRECCLVGNGSTEFIYLLPEVIRPHRVLIVTPAFTEYERSYRFRSAHVTRFPARAEDRFMPDVDRLCHELHKGYDVLYLANPGNPTGVLIPKPALRKIIRAAHCRKTIVVLDEAFIDFSEFNSMKTEVQTYENLIILRSLTKFFGIPGLRIGYVIAHPDMTAALAACHQPWSCNAIAQRAAVLALRSPGFITRSRAYVRDARKRFAESLSDIRGLSVVSGAANFLLLQLTTPRLTATELYQQLLQDGIIIRTCEDFHGLDTSYCRVAVKKKSQNRKLVAALKKILEPEQ